MDSNDATEKLEKHLNLLKGEHTKITERALVSSVGLRSCVRFYCVAEEVGAASLLEYCSGLISTLWDDLTPQDFEHMSGPLLYKMLKSKTKHPLHVAVRLLREDVVFLCLVENGGALGEIVNSLSPQGQLPLGLALLGRSQAIAQTLVQNGNADVNAYDGDGCTLLIDAVKRGDGSAAHFLLEKNCNVNLTSRTMQDTALHVTCTYSDLELDPDTHREMLKIGKLLLERGADVNVQNAKGFSPLHVAIASGHKEMIILLLEKSETDLNLQTNDGEFPLQTAVII